MEQRKLKVAICGYGNLGKGVEKAIPQNPDMELVGIFSRRPAEQLGTTSKVLSMENIEMYQDDIDVVIMCGGSANDLEVQVPEFAKYFNTVDSFDTHARIPEYYKIVDEAAKSKEHISIISVGWDPGMFSLMRLFSEVILPQGNTYTFWGKGISQGHSNAIRRIEGVKNAVQYTIPISGAVEKVRRGENPQFTTRQKHLRECFVVLEEGADSEKVKEEIVTMPNYFADYDTIVHFISEEELKKEHSGMPHGGFVIRSGITGENTKQLVEYSLNLESNPEFTASVLLAYGRAACKMYDTFWEPGAKTVFDVPPILLSSKSKEELLSSTL
ncbi:MAG: diaminopimelate dehydrogenase [Clostridia bacterium]|nr:diaminopimelate dehydrogenase [Clostridia bacterium]